MKPKTRDYLIFDKFNFTRKPVGIKFLPYKPEGIRRPRRQEPVFHGECPS